MGLVENSVLKTLKYERACHFLVTTRSQGLLVLILPSESSQRDYILPVGSHIEVTRLSELQGYEDIHQA